MRTSIIGIFMLTFCFISTSFAQNYFWSNKESSAPAKQSGPIQVLSPQQFENTVSTLHQKTQSELDQERIQQFAKARESQGSAAESNPNIPIGAQPTGVAPAVPLSPPVGSSASPVNPVTPAAPIAPAQPAQQQPYTGFMGGTTNPNQSAAPSNTTGQTSGWKIQY